MSESFFPGQHPLHLFKGICGGLAEDALGGEVAPYWPAYKVMGSCIANVLNDCRIYIAQINETLGQGGACQSWSRQHQDYQDKASTDEHFAKLCVWHSSISRSCRSPRHQSGPRMAHRESQNTFTAAVTPLLMMSRRSAESILSSSSRLMIEPASSRTAGIRVDLSTTS